MLLAVLTQLHLTEELMLPMIEVAYAAPKNDTPYADESADEAADKDVTDIFAPDPTSPTYAPGDTRERTTARGKVVETLLVPAVWRRRRAG